MMPVTTFAIAYAIKTPATPSKWSSTIAMGMYKTSIRPTLIHTAGNYTLSVLDGMSVSYYRLAAGATGTVTAVLLVPVGANYTVVVK